jgi:hypothetical protein
MKKIKSNKPWLLAHIFFLLSAIYVPFAFNEFTQATYAIGGNMGVPEKIFLLSFPQSSVLISLIVFSCLIPLLVKKSATYVIGLFPLGFVIYAAINLKANIPVFLDVKNIEFLNTLSNPSEVHQLGLGVGFYISTALAVYIALISVRRFIAHRAI